MVPDPPKPPTERTETDASLRAERTKTDDELARRGTAAAHDADAVVELARERADILLDTARIQARVALQEAGVGSADRDALLLAQASAQETVTIARTVAHDKLEAERLVESEALALLLKLERRETDERLTRERKRSDQVVASRDEFLAMVSHDVRGLLAGIALSADLLKRAPEDGSHVIIRREADRVERLTGRMTRLVSDLIDVVSMETGTLNMIATQQDAGRILTETIETFQHAATAHTVRMTAHVPDAPILATFDHDRILQVLANLVGNALKFTRSGGAIALTLAADERELRVTVEDNGRGIAAEHREVIFERFSQPAQTDRRGLGLGLYIARSIVAAHKGRIWVESVPGQGSAFHFTLPRNEVPAAG